MSPSTRDPDKRSVEELEDRIDELEDELERVRSTSVTFSQLNLLLDALGGDVVDVADARDDPMKLKRDLELVAAERQEVGELAKKALGAARAIDDGERADGGPSKVEHARILSRDEAVRRALEDSGRGGAVTAGQVRDMAKPERNLRYQTVYDAWSDLRDRWDVFNVDDREERSKRLIVHRDDLKDAGELVGVVEESLDRSDLSKRLMSRSS